MVSTTASTITIIAANAALVFGAIGVQTFWVNKRLELIEQRLDRLETRLDQMFAVLLTHGERITKLEEART